MGIITYISFTSLGSIFGAVAPYLVSPERDLPLHDHLRMTDQVLSITLSCNVVLLIGLVAGFKSSLCALKHVLKYVYGKVSSVLATSKYSSTVNPSCQYKSISILTSPYYFFSRGES